MGIGGISIFQLGMILIGAVVFVAIIKALLNRGGGEGLICTRCGTSGQTRWVIPGHWLIELVLWLLLIVPGLIYTIWRASSRHQACKACGSRDLVPLESPAGRNLAQQFQAEVSAASQTPAPRTAGKHPRDTPRP